MAIAGLLLTSTNSLTPLDKGFWVAQVFRVSDAGDYAASLKTRRTAARKSSGLTA
jgi:hypothetical protein